MRKARLVLVAIFALALLAVPATAGAKSRDRDHDGMADKWEKKHNLSTHKANAKKDPDKDGLKNLREFKRHTDPRDADSDNDGLEDRDELRTGCDPRDRDSDDDGREDGDEFGGTIQSFDSTTGVLTILLADGENTIHGRVTDATEIECENEDEDLRAAHRGGDDDGDNSGPGSDNSGPGSGGDDNDRGDDDDDGDDEPGDDNDDDDREDCGTEALTEGRVVHEAELTNDGSGPVFREVELDA